MREGKYCIAITGKTVDKYLPLRLLGLFKQYEADKVCFKIKKCNNIGFVKSVKECLDLLNIQYTIFNKDTHIGIVKQMPDLNYRLLLEADLLLIFWKDKKLVEEADRLNIPVLVLRNRG